ncbi:MAG: uracil-DNA glycosylase [Hydrotalea sp.]|nr:uracil-DNA glycosylase [Hydrotalea sp.]
MPSLINSPAVTLHTPPRDCPLCPDLCQHRQTLRAAHHDWYNAPVAGFGDLQARVFIIGLAPGERGANRTGRPFTGDKAGDYLYTALREHQFASGNYGGVADDGLTLQDVFISNSVKCAPPKHRNVSPLEKRNCRQFLIAELTALKNLRVILTLGQTAHQALFELFADIDDNIKIKNYKFGHKQQHHVVVAGRAFDVINSYHCSQRNMNTKILSPADFLAVFSLIHAMIEH